VKIRAVKLQWTKGESEKALAVTDCSRMKNNRKFAQMTDCRGVYNAQKSHLEMGRKINRIL